MCEIGHRCVTLDVLLLGFPSSHPENCKKLPKKRDHGENPSKGHHGFDSQQRVKVFALL